MNTQRNRLNAMQQRRHKKADPAVPYMGLVECLETIVEYGRHSKALNYCVNYAKHGIEIDRKYDNEVDPDELHLVNENARKFYNEMHTQLLYVLSNMTHWRGEMATNVRVNLRNHVKQLEDLQKEH